MILVKIQIRDRVWEQVSNRVWIQVQDQFRVQLSKQLQMPIGHISIQIRSKVIDYLEKYNL